MDPSSVSPAAAALQELGAILEVDPTGQTVITCRLNEAAISDADLEHLKSLTNVQSLTLSEIPITNAGLEHLKGLTNLQTLQLIGTQVTDAEVADLQNALPNVRIQRRSDQLFQTSSLPDFG